MTYTLSCIKCGKAYEDTEPEPYYCVDCKKQKDAIAAQVDKQMAGRSKIRPKTPLQEYEEAEKVHGKFMRVNL